MHVIFVDSWKQEQHLSQEEAGESFSLMCSSVFEEETRKTFTGHLYAALTRRRIHTFIDNESLEKREKIHELLEYIKKSKIFVPIISRGYAESQWCLMEVTQRVKTGRLIIPVFLDVEPSAVKNQSGPFEDAFQEHTNNKNVSEETVNEWRDSLRQVAALVGYVLVIQTEGYAYLSLSLKISSLLPFIEKILGFSFLYKTCLESKMLGVGET
uniref:ADP-ribosyl cyclase/cyclic ADP-ribose hydrolase n=1 Tax=Nymphaea colorata TaxID=210225 RepID=A0A5K1BPQ4_9MAGN